MPYKSHTHLKQGQAPAEKAEQELQEGDVPETVIDFRGKAFRGNNY